MTALPRCPRCAYALVRGVCPIHGGRQVSERLPMVAPLPAARGAENAIPFRKARKARRRSA